MSTPRSESTPSPAPGSADRQLAQAGSTPSVELPAVDLSSISPFEVALSAVVDQPEGELVLVPSLDPVNLVLAIRQTGDIPADLREVRRRVIWTCNAGEVIASVATPTSAAHAQFYPPQVSTHVKVEAELVVVFEREGSARVVEHTARASLQLLTPLPSEGNLVKGYIGDYQIGEYLDPRNPEVARQYALESDWYRKYPDRYQRPEFFYKVEENTKPLRIGPNTFLDTWVIDFPWRSFGLPQYIAIDPNLLLKLEELIEMLRADGHKVTRFVPIYGFRPPWFNLGTIESNPDTNLKVPFSMHQYGRAVDFIIDEDGDGVMDDLNGDGKHDIHDAAVIMHYVNIIDRKYREAGRMEMVGGAGLYPCHDFTQRPTQTPYIHVDTRGFVGEGNRLIRWPNNWPVQNKNGKWVDGPEPIRFGSI